MTIVKEMLKERVRRVQVHQHVQEKTARAGFGGLSIQRTPLGTHVRISAERPGLVIGRKGSDIQQLTDDLERKFEQASKYISIEQLGVAPKCGFSSTEEGNIISFDDQKRKLELVIETANKIWGE